MSKWMNGGAPTDCAFCTKPFDGKATHGKDKRYYCDEFCEAEAAELIAKRLREAS